MPTPFKAPVEAVADKPMFCDAFRRHRCLILLKQMMSGAAQRPCMSLETLAALSDSAHLSLTAVADA